MESDGVTDDLGSSDERVNLLHDDEDGENAEDVSPLGYAVGLFETMRQAHSLGVGVFVLLALSVASLVPVPCPRLSSPVCDKEITGCGVPVKNRKMIGPVGVGVAVAVPVEVAVNSKVFVAVNVGVLEG